MQIGRNSFGLGIVAAASLALAGCGNNSTQGTDGHSSGSSSQASHDADGHDDHADHDEDEGHDEHGHPSEGPHHGHLIELGNEEYHAEMLHEEDTNTVTIYILDSAAKKEVLVAEGAVMLNLMVKGQPRQFTMNARPDANAPRGQASHFEIVDADLMEALEGEEAKGRLRVTINGKSYRGTIEHEDHDEHDEHHGRDEHDDH